MNGLDDCLSANLAYRTGLRVGVEQAHWVLDSRSRRGPCIRVTDESKLRRLVGFDHSVRREASYTQHHHRGEPTTTTASEQPQHVRCYTALQINSSAEPGTRRYDTSCRSSTPTSTSRRGVTLDIAELECHLRTCLGPEAHWRIDHVA